LESAENDLAGAQEASEARIGELQNELDALQARADSAEEASAKLRDAASGQDAEAAASLQDALNERSALESTLDAIRAELATAQEALGGVTSERDELAVENERFSNEIETLRQGVAAAREVMDSQDDRPSVEMVMSIDDEEETIGVAGSVPVEEVRELIASVTAHREFVIQGVNRWKGIEHSVGQAVSELVQFSSRHPELQEQLFPMLNELKSALDTGRNVVVKSEDYFSEQEPLASAIVQAIDSDES